MSEATNQLRRGDLVEVRAPAEILETLDGDGAVDGMPFMPEMAAYCGGRFLVDRRADKVCDTAMRSGSRKVQDSVLLANLRCNGSAHGGCQAECRIFWKDAWLRKVTAETPPSAPASQEDLAALVERASSNVRGVTQAGSKSVERWFCQNTQLYQASEQVRIFDPSVYVGQYLNGNVSLGGCVRVTARAALWETLVKLGKAPDEVLRGPGTFRPGEPLDLRPGDWVQVRSKEEIVATLTPEGRNRGLWFDREMALFCGTVSRVRQRISRFIDELDASGRMVEMKSDAVTLENVVCGGEHSQARWFCPRQIYPYWRECWLRRVDAPVQSAPRQ
jgi:hypothetical protein